MKPISIAIVTFSLTGLFALIFMVNQLEAMHYILLFMLLLLINYALKTPEEKGIKRKVSFVILALTFFKLCQIDLKSTIAIFCILVPLGIILLAEAYKHKIEKKKSTIEKDAPDN